MAASPQSAGSIASAQAAILSGTVSDPTGALVPEALVRISGMGVAEQTATDERGAFQFRIPTGIYTLQIDAPGFAQYAKQRVQVDADGRLHLPVRLAIATLNQEITVQTDRAGSTDAGANGSAVSLEGDQLRILSDDPATLQQQINALAGPSFGGGGPQILVNGFSGGRLPPKTSIRSIRVGQNPFSAYYDAPGFGRVEIETKPGTDKLHGDLNFAGTDQPLDTRTPYNFGVQPPFYQFQSDGDLNGPINKNTAFYLSESVQQLGNDAVVNATVLNGALATAALSEAVPAPQHTDTFSARVDRQFTASNFGFLRDEWSETHLTDGGLGAASSGNPTTTAGATTPASAQTLPSAGFTSNVLTNTLQLSDTQLLGPSALNEVRFQYLRTRTSQQPNSTEASLSVEGAFAGGGDVQQSLHDNTDRYELQDRFQLTHGAHAVQTGFRLRELREASASSANFNGQFTFDSIGAYQITEQGLAVGLPAAQIRANGGGASQFALTAGQPSAALVESDLGVYAEDDWRLRPALTLSYGLRIESQTAVPDHFNPAPRLGVGWAVRRGNKPMPVVVLRAGYGIFYDRFPAANILEAIRQNGASEVAYLAQNPDFFPNIPSTSQLTATEPTIYRVSPTLRTSYNQVGLFEADRPLGRLGRLSANFVYAHGSHEYLTRNLNAPLPGTYNPVDPGSGVRPLGNSQNVYQYSSDSNESSAIFFLRAQLQPFAAASPRLAAVKGLSIYGLYQWQHQRNESDGVNSFPSEPYNLRADFARNSGIPAQTGQIVLFDPMTWGMQTALFANTHSGVPFDITTGTDLNGDTIFNDRPSFATDLTRPSVARTAFGNFDTVPIAGQQIIPRNYGTSPGLLFLDLQISKEVHLGPRPAGAGAAPSQGSSAATAKKPDRPWDLRFEVEVQNLTNHNNPGLPDGVIGLIPCTAASAPGCAPAASPDFGHSLSLASDFSPLTTSNRTIILHSFFSF